MNASKRRMEFRRKLCATMQEVLGKFQLQHGKKLGLYRIRYFNIRPNTEYLW